MVSAVEVVVAVRLPWIEFDVMCNVVTHELYPFSVLLFERLTTLA